MRPARALRSLVLAPALLAAGVAGCAGPAQRAREAGFSRTWISTPRFELNSWHRGLGRATYALHVYIEGDGRAFVHGWVSDDPTPHEALGLELARRDPAPAVLYLARPCQYLDRHALAACDPKYWSTDRFADEVIASTSAAVDWALARWPHPPPIALVGYSGGGSVAVLLARRRHDVIALVTVAANLDHAAWTAYHRVPPLSGSLNPAALPAPGPAAVPQLHLAGARDEVVPPAIVARFVAAQGLPSSTLRVVAGYTHSCCWTEHWPEPLCGLDPRLCQHR